MNRPKIDWCKPVGHFSKFDYCGRYKLLSEIIQCSQDLRLHSFEGVSFTWTLIAELSITTLFAWLNISTMMTASLVLPAECVMEGGIIYQSSGSDGRARGIGAKKIDVHEQARKGPSIKSDGSYVLKPLALRLRSLAHEADKLCQGCPLASSQLSVCMLKRSSHGGCSKAIRIHCLLALIITQVQHSYASTIPTSSN